MKKKILLLAIIAFFFTGCSVNYNLEITKDLNFKEEIVINSNVMPLSESEFIEQYRQPVYPDSTEIYNLTTEINESNQIIRYYYEHKQNNFSNNTFINRCYHGTKLTNTDGTLTLKTSNNFQCMHMYPNLNADKVDINIITKLRVIGNNADEVNGNKYTWHITPDNYQNKPINLEIKTPNSSPIVSTTTKDTFILAITVLTIGFLVVIFVKRKRQKNNNL